MNDSVVFYAFVIVALWWLSRGVNRVLKNIDGMPGARDLDYRARAFVDPVQTAPYWLMIEYLQLGVGAAILLIGIALRIWWVALTISLLVYAGLALLLHKVLFTQIFTFGYFSFVDRQEKRPSRILAFKALRFFTRAGNLILGVLLYVPAWILLYRLDFGLIAYCAVAFLPFFTVRVLRHVSAIALQTPRPPWIPIGTALVFIPFLCAWLAGSVAWWIKTTEKALVESVKTNLTTQKKCDRELTRTRWGTGDRQIHVAVALSGGGYRAALAHAGLLAALDHQCVPIDYLTTVSGGSIIGTAYALGIPPSAFLERLRKSRPGLPNDLLSVSGVMREWILPWSSNTKVYSDHFRHNFFGNRTLAHLAESPRLLINATDVESGSYEAREVFFKGRAPQLKGEGGQTLDETTSIADVVAASGAFPGAFQPMRLRWVSDDTATAITERKFVDGGVVENLGLEGLRRYLTLGSHLPPRPDVLIISDASQYSASFEFRRKAEFVRLLARSQNLSYTALHRQLYARYTGRADFWTWSREEPLASQVSIVRYDGIDPHFAHGEPEHLMTVVIPLTAPTPTRVLQALSGCELAPGHRIADVQHEVSAFDTLRELEAKEAEAAYWLGYNLGLLYADAIECARLRAIDPSHICAPSPGVTNCQSWEQILSSN